MSELSRCDPTGRFSGLADVYARHRPTYPDEAIQYVLEHCSLGRGSVVVDVGSGTGISTRQFAARGLTAVGIEPNADMRARAEAEPVPPGIVSPSYRDGRAEATGLPDAFCHAVLAAQAFHWFKPNEALVEFRRILKPGGWVVVLGNERDELDSFTAAFGAVIRSTKDAAAIEEPRARAGDGLLTSDLFEENGRAHFRHEQELDEEGVLGRAFSASYIPRDPASVAAISAALREVFSRFHQEGQVRLKYVTTVTSARRPGS
jgi:SAM-dependent methyltransferase